MTREISGAFEIEIDRWTVESTGLVGGDGLVPSQMAGGSIRS